jgi:peptidyl-tRNA hydrolase
MKLKNHRLAKGKEVFFSQKKGLKKIIIKFNSLVKLCDAVQSMQNLSLLHKLIQS